MNPLLACRKLPLLRCLATGVAACLLGATAPGAHAEIDKNRPNIVLILADDMGIGDVSGLNPEGKIPTPHIDRMITRGLTLHDAHTSSAVCTPTRYSLLTGRYNWRNARKKGVARGFTPSEIEPGRATLASMLGQAGYRTAMIGKWHLGLDWVEDPNLKPAFPTTYIRSKKSRDTPGVNVDFAQPFRGGPVDHGFDSFFGIAASLDMPPYLWLIDDKASEVPTVLKTYVRTGPASTSFKAIDVLPRLGQETVKFINRHAKDAKNGKPFFVYLPLASPHTPIVPSAAWKGRSAIGEQYADFTMETDAAVGQVLKALEANGISDNTLVIFTTDNGCSPAAGFKKLVDKGHQPSWIYRGHKNDLYEGGHRVPTVMHWPAVIQPGRSSDQLIVQTDLFRTFADLVGQTVGDDAAEDSISFLPLLNGESDRSERINHVAHAFDCHLSIREGKWKLIVHPGSGGWTPLGMRFRGEKPKDQALSASDVPPMGLYDLEQDPGEYHNLLEQHPNIARDLIKQLTQTIAEGRSTPGAPQKNNGKVPLKLPKGW